MLIFHILTALTSIAAATVLFFRPGKPLLFINYGLAITTLVSGTYIIVASKTHLLQTCLVGLFYLVGVSYCIAMAQRKLSLQELYKSSKD